MSQWSTFTLSFPVSKTALEKVLSFSFICFDLLALHVLAARAMCVCVCVCARAVVVVVVTLCCSLQLSRAVCDSLYLEE